MSGRRPAAAPLPLFVYGSLMRGESNHRLLTGAEPLGPAETGPGFELVDLGPYPGMAAGGGRRRVAGELYRVDARTLARLDAFEGHPGYYRRTVIHLADGRPAEAYLLAPRDARGRPRLGPPGSDGGGAGTGEPPAVAWRSSRPRPPR